MKEFKIEITQSQLSRLYPNGWPKRIKTKQELLQHSINSNKLDISDDLLIKALQVLRDEYIITQFEFNLHVHKISDEYKMLLIKSKEIRNLITLKPKRKRIKRLAPTPMQV